MNAVYVFDDQVVLPFNYKDGTRTINLSDIKSSDLDGFGHQEKHRNVIRFGAFIFYLKIVQNRAKWNAIADQLLN